MYDTCSNSYIIIINCAEFTCRGPQRLTKLAEIKDGIILKPILADLLNLTVLVTGALLVGIYRELHNSSRLYIFSIGASIQTPTIGII